MRRTLPSLLFHPCRTHPFQVEAVTSERAARRKWKGAAKEPPEYLI